MTAKVKSGANDKAKLFEKNLERARGEIVELRVLLTNSLGVSLPSVPESMPLHTFKHFCSGLLEGADHPWAAALSDVSPVVRSTIAATLFLFRKRLPTAPDPALRRSYADKMVKSAALTVDPDFRAHCKSVIRKIFGVGWDRSYHRRVAAATLPLSATYDNDRSSGGARFSDLAPSRDEYSRMCHGHLDIPRHDEVRVSVVNDGGKDRVVTVGPVHRLSLKPLHGLIYDHISKQGWCLRGDAKPKSFDRFLPEPGEVYVSGDYESATDNLSLELYEDLLKWVLETAENVPASVKEYAVSTCRSQLYVDGALVGLQARGQLMGNLLSFPFLCLTNFLAFKYAVPRKGVPIKINGDDIVFRSTRGECEDWMAMVGKSGLVLSKGKTLVNPCLFSLNSTFFRVTPTRVKWVPFVRSKALFARPESLDQFRGQYSALCPGFCGPRRDVFRVAFLARTTRVWRSSQRSFSRGLGLRVSDRVLRAVGAWDREQFYLSVPFEPTLPTPPSTLMLPQPEGYHRVDIHRFPYGGRASVKDASRFWMEDAIDLAWTSRFRTRYESGEWYSYWDAIRKGTYRYSPDKSRVGRNTLASIRNALLSRYGPLRQVIRPAFQQVSELVWERDSFEEREGGVRCRVTPLKFVLGK